MMHPVLTGKDVVLPFEPLVFPLDRVQPGVLLALLLPQLAKRGGCLRLEFRERLPQEVHRRDGPAYRYQPCHAARDDRVGERFGKWREKGAGRARDSRSAIGGF